MHFFKFNLVYSLEMRNDTFKCENFKCLDSNASDYSCITWLMFTTRYRFFCSCIMGVRTSENRNRIVIIKWYQIQKKLKIYSSSLHTSSIQYNIQILDIQFVLYSSKLFLHRRLPACDWTKKYFKNVLIRH